MSEVHDDCPACLDGDRESHHASADTPERDANANLIAAAPELLEALRLTLEFVEEICREHGTKPESLEEVKAARAAIAKASGGES